MSVRSPLSRIALLTILLTTFAAGCGSKESDQVTSGGGESGETELGGQSSSPTASMPSALNSTETGGHQGARGINTELNFGNATYPSVPSEVQKTPVSDPHPRVIVRTSAGDFTVELDREKAPQTVDNFLINYVSRSFYEETCFHYVDKGFMIAAGGFTSDLEAKPVRAAIRNESRNGLKNLRGTIAMARHPEYPHSATSQFFINLVDNPSLDHQELSPVSTSEAGDEETFEEIEEEVSYQPNGYCVFGKVVEGLNVIDKIAEAEVSDRAEFPRTPVKPIVIHSIERIR